MQLTCVRNDPAKQSWTSQRRSNKFKTRNCVAEFFVQTVLSFEGQFERMFVCEVAVGQLY